MPVRNVDLLQDAWCAEGRYSRNPSPELAHLLAGMYPAAPPELTPRLERVLQAREGRNSRAREVMVHIHAAGHAGVSAPMLGACTGMDGRALRKIVARLHAWGLVEDAGEVPKSLLSNLRGRPPRLHRTHKEYR